MSYMRIFAAICLVSFLYVNGATAQTWKWVSGDSLVNGSPVYGVQGIASAANVPGARTGAVSWDAGNGMLYIFGGYGKDSSGAFGALNDVWKYDTGSGSWTWIAGSALVSQPGVYGVRGIGAVGNTPGARQLSAAWFVHDSLFLFGGEGLDVSTSSGILNDVWSFSITTGLWTWHSGDSIRNASGVYGVQGVPDAANTPGARHSATAWYAADNRLYLFGGNGKDTVGVNGSLNDLWRYDPGTGMWTWLAGSKLRDRTGAYGTKAIAAAGNVPGGREGAVAFPTGDSSLYFFGGLGFDSQGDYWDLNDLWKYDIGTGMWTWISGATLSHQSAVYGTRGIPASTNMPGGHTGGAHGWAPGDGYLYLFGGPGLDANGNSGYLNDLWRYSLASGEWCWISGANGLYQFGSYNTKDIVSVRNVPGARAMGCVWSPGNGKLYLFGGYGYVASSNDGRLNDLWIFDTDEQSVTGNIPNGWQLVASPVYRFDMSPNGIFGDDMVSMPSLFQYSPASSYTSVSTMELGRGYWMYVSDTVAVDAEGQNVDVTSMQLEQGWNIVSNPFDVDCTIPTMLRFSDGTTTKTLAEATTAGWVGASFYGYNGVSYSAAASVLVPWMGYWLYGNISGVQILFSRTPFP